MTNDLEVLLVQFDIAWHKPESNFRRLKELLSKKESMPQLIVLPEMFCCGFTDTPEALPDNLSETVIEWMKNLAQQHNATVAGSYPHKSGKGYFNRMLTVLPNQTIYTYDKKHLFALGNESKRYKPGTKQITYSIDEWKFKPIVCYDLRFPVWCRNTSDYDVLIVIANWPESRNRAWEALLKARAIENQCYVLGVNRAGVDGLGIPYLGRTQILSPLGEQLICANDSEEELLELSLSRFDLQKCRRMYPFLRDRDEFILK